jgi:hypothetical protein
MTSGFSFNVVCTTIGRESLSRLIESLVFQLNENDIFTVISDNNHDYVSQTLSKYHFRSTVHHIKNKNGPSGKFGHPLINQHINNLDGDFLMFADDDDYYVSDAFHAIRKVVNDKKLYIFKHKWGNTVNWTTKNVILGNVGKCMGVIPNNKNLPLFQEDVLGDGLFYEKLVETMDYEFIDKIIYKVRNTI